jgi:hypothetical protein
MDLSLVPGLASAYTSRSQKARVMTEAWVKENMYCPACSSEELRPAPQGTEVVDFSCPDCEEQYQLKSKSSPFTDRVTDSAFDPKIRAIRQRSCPSLLLLQYSLSAFQVSNLLAIPRYFIHESIVEKRRPLGAHARRHGWVGSNILIGSLPADARIYIVNNGRMVPEQIVRSQWRQFSFMNDRNADSRGWIVDVLMCIRQLGKVTFTINDMYSFEGHLAELHPRNRHIRPKIRQQLQMLRDHGVIDFKGSGVYRVLVGE